MPTQYDFQNLEREIINLEKDAIKAVNSFNSITDTITRAKFNSSEYSQRAISQKVSRIIDNTKNKTAAAYSNYLNSTIKSINTSLNTVNQAAKTAGEYGNMLNAHLRDLDNLNKFFSNKQFRQVITTGINVDVFPAEIASYVLFLKLESYDSICKAYQENITLDNYHDFKEYYLLSKNNNAPKHFVSASSLLFIASYALSISDSNCPYDICLDGLKCYSDLPEDLRKLVQSAYDELYSIAIEMYNASCENAYSSFDYLKVKELLLDSQLFSKNDITIDFFRDSTVSPKKLFEYASGYSSNASAETMQYVLVDTVSLSNGDTAKDYFAFWLKRYDDYGFVFIKQAIDSRQNIFEAEQLICDLLPGITDNLSHPGNLTFDLANDYQTYLESISSEIPLFPFLESAISWDSAISKIAPVADKADSSEFEKAFATIDGLSYSMISKYQKYCGCYDTNLINDLNNVLNQSSIRLYGKPFKKPIRKAETARDDVYTLTVKLVSFQKRKKRLTWLIIIGVTLLILEIIIIILLLTNKMPWGKLSKQSNSSQLENTPVYTLQQKGIIDEKSV